VVGESILRGGSGAIPPTDGGKIPGPRRTFRRAYRTSAAQERNDSSWAFATRGCCLRAESPVAADSAAGIASEITTITTSAERISMERAYPPAVCATARAGIAET